MEIRYRLLRRQRVIHLASAGFWALLGVFQLVVIRHWFPYQLIIAPIFFSYYFIFARFGVDLAPSGLTLHGLRTPRIPWEDIADITLGNFLGSEFVKVRLRTGRTRRLRAPVTGPLQNDPDFREKAATIRHWWLHYTGQLAA
jgi:hypothetical protein